MTSKSDFVLVGAFISLVVLSLTGCATTSTPSFTKVALKPQSFNPKAGLSICVENESSFDVMYYRRGGGDANMGLAGNLGNRIAEASLDESLVQKLQPALKNNDLKAAMEHRLVESLRRNGSFAAVRVVDKAEFDRKDNPDLKLFLKVAFYGMELCDEGKLGATVRATFRLSAPSTGQVLWEREDSYQENACHSLSDAAADTRRGDEIIGVAGSLAEKGANELLFP